MRAALVLLDGVHAGLETVAALAGVIPDLGAGVVIDHFGLARATDGVAHPGFAALLELVAGAGVYVKLSAPDRLSPDPDIADVAPLARALIAARPDRMLWGSDWPHTGTGARSPAERDATEPFRAVDDAAALRRLGAWTTDASELRRIMVDNPARLYGA